MPGKKDKAVKQDRKCARCGKSDHVVKNCKQPDTRTDEQKAEMRKRSEEKRAKAKAAEAKPNAKSATDASAVEHIKAVITAVFLSSNDSAVTLGTFDTEGVHYRPMGPSGDGAKPFLPVVLKGATVPAAAIGLLHKVVYNGETSALADGAVVYRIGQTGPCMTSWTAPDRNARAIGYKTVDRTVTDAATNTTSTIKMVEVLYSFAAAPPANLRLLTPGTDALPLSELATYTNVSGALVVFVCKMETGKPKPPESLIAYMAGANPIAHIKAFLEGDFRYLRWLVESLPDRSKADMGAVMPPVGGRITASGKLTQQSMEWIASWVRFCAERMGGLPPSGSVAAAVGMPLAAPA